MKLPAEGFRTVVFDCDSTLTRIEGVDELAGPRSAEIAALTDAAMRGEVALEEVYGRRLEIIRPTRDQVDDLGRRYVANLVPEARETIAALRWLGKDIRIISGGLRPPVEALGKELGIPPEAVSAVGIRFREDGTYADYDRASPLARSGGKLEVLRDWGLIRPILLVGDGMTDLEARPAVDAFVAFTGVAHRESVVARADAVVDGPGLGPLLAISLTAAERRRLEETPWAGLVGGG